MNGLSHEELGKALDRHRDIAELQARLGVYAYLVFSSDTSKPESQALLGEREELNAEIGAQLVFFDLELGKAAYSSSLPDHLSSYAYPLRQIEERAKHNLTEELEAYGLEKDLTGRRALTALFDEVAGSFSFEEDTPEGRKKFTQETALSVMNSPDRAYRHKIYTRFLEEVGNGKVITNNIYNNILLDHRMDTKRRGFGHVMDPRCLENQVSRAAVESMLDAVEEGYPVAQRYFSLKARILGWNDMTNADIYAPLGTSRLKFTFDDAWKTTREAYGRFDARIGALVDDFAGGRRIDAALRQGKRPGAFCYGAFPSIPAFVFLNFTGELRSVQTLAHELGHGVHHELSRSQNHMNFQTPLVTAETASVFGEILLNEFLIETTSSPAEKLAILAAQMEAMIATVFRQTVLTRFEQRAHAAREKGRVADEEFCRIWWEENAKLYGNSLTMVAPYKWGWAYIPHFVHTPFYCYAYSFGQLLVLALYAAYLEKPAGFADRYRLLLSSGSSARPADLVKGTIGLDIEAPGFWQSAIGLLDRTMKRIEELAPAARS